MEPDSPFEIEVIRVLRNHGWVVHPQVGCSGYRIDIGVVDPRAPGRYLIGIECDGRTYHSGSTARDRDRLRQHVLENLGWRIHRIWSTNWWLNPKQEIQKVLDRLQALLDEEQSPAEPSVMGDTPDSQVAEPPGSDQEEAFPAGTAMPVYSPVTLTVREPDAFHDLQSVAILTEQLSDVIEGEGPISESLLFRKIARAWGLERTGSRIVGRLKMLVPSHAGRTRENTNTFYWPSAVNPASMTYFRVSDDSPHSKRHIDDVCLEEIAALVLQVLLQAGSTPHKDITRSVCRLIGMNTTTAPAVARVALAIQGLRNSLIIVETDGNLCLPRYGS